MQLEKIISISGKPGLFTLVSQLKNGFIVEDISTGKKASISNSSQVSLLDNIAIYTFEQEVPLFEVMKNIAEKYDYKEAINHKSSEKELREFMSQVLPNYDVERVYGSDIKKLVQWYNLMQKAGFITKEAFVKAEETVVDEAEVVEEKPAKAEKKPAAKKAAPKTEKAAAPKAKASASAKSTVKSTQRKQG